MPDQTKPYIINHLISIAPQGIEVWLTRADQSALFQQQKEAPLFVNAINGGPTLQVDTTQFFQTMEGFGFALTGGSALLINHLPALTRNALLRELFSTDGNGIGVSFLRLSIGASDLSERSFSYDDMPEGQADPGLAHFNIEAGDSEVIPLLKEILVINPAIKLIGSPWSAPPWMKTNQSFIGGNLKPEYFHVYANYLVMYINAMNERGITVHALTLQNEPLNEDNEPSMLMEAWEQADFVKNHLGPALREAGLGRVELFCWDHNCDVKEYPLAVLADADARQFLTGAAWHLYAGDIRAVSEVSKAYPDMKMYFTEQWVGGADNAVELTSLTHQIVGRQPFAAETNRMPSRHRDADLLLNSTVLGGADDPVSSKGRDHLDAHFAADLSWHMRNVIIGATRNGCQAVLEWNLASDPQYDPHTPRGCANCVGALTIGNDMTIIPNVSYFVIAHIAKFVRPGSIRIFSNDWDALPNVAFATPYGTVVLIVLNENTDAQTFNIQFSGKLATIVLEGGTVATCVWKIV